MLPQPPSAPTPTTTWHSFCLQLPPWEQPFLQDIRFDAPFTPADLHDFFSQSTIRLLLVSDGSAPTQTIGTYAWVLGTKDDVLVRSAGCVTGFPIDSLRAEGYGKLAGLLFLKRFTEYMGCLPACHLTTYLDNESVQKQTSPPNDMPQSNLRNSVRANYDVINEIRHTQAELSSRFRNLHPSKHVRGHQDRHQSTQQLTRPAVLNILADSEAGTLRDAVLAGNFPIPDFLPFPHCPAYITAGDIFHCSHERTLTLWRHGEFRLHQYLCRRLSLSRSQLDDINWHVFRLSQQNLDSAQQRFLPKFIADWLPTEHKLQRYKSSDGRCPFCHDHDETVDHFIQCQHPDSPTRSFRSSLNKQLIALHTDPEVRTAILDQVTVWLDQSPTNPILRLVRRPRAILQRFLHITPRHLTEVQTAINHQTQLGWRLWLWY